MLKQEVLKCNNKNSPKGEFLFILSKRKTPNVFGVFKELLDYLFGFDFIFKTFFNNPYKVETDISFGAYNVLLSFF